MSGAIDMQVRGGEPKSRWFRAIARRARPRLRLVCFPHVGGTPGFFLPWGELVPDDVELLAVCYPGREHRLLDPPATTMAELADDIARECVPLLDTPLMFFGHSLGASVGYEVASRLQACHGVTLVGLAVSGSAGPGRETPTDLADSSDDEIIAELTGLNGTDARVFGNPELLELIMPAIRADYRLAENYVRRPEAATVAVRLAAPVVAYYGDQEEDLDEAAVAAWSAVTTGGFRMRRFEGNHFFLVEHARTLVTDLFAGVPGS